MPNVFFTGATGFIGRHLVPRFTQKYRAVVLNRPKTPHDLAGVDVIDGDVSDAEALAPAGEARVIYHMAAISSVPGCAKDPERALGVNVRGTLNVLEAARKSVTVERVVVMSSAHVYGQIQMEPVNEDHPLDPISIYGATKVAADRLAHAYHHAYGIPVVIVRAFNVFGPGQAPEFLIPSLLGQLAGGQPPTLGDGDLVRDFLYIDDFIEFLATAALKKRAEGEVFNVGSGEGTRLADLVRQLMETADVEGEPTFDLSRQRPGESRRIVVDRSKAERLLGWAPRTSLADGLQRTWAAYAAASHSPRRNSH